MRNHRPEPNPTYILRSSPGFSGSLIARFVEQATLSALEGRAIRARASALAGSAGYSLPASAARGDGSAWVRDLPPMLAEKQELISRQAALPPPHPAFPSSAVASFPLSFLPSHALLTLVRGKGVHPVRNAQPYCASHTP